MKRFVRIGMLMLLGACGGDSRLVPDYRVLSSEGTQHQGADYSPDGSKIAYWSAAAGDTPGQNQLWVANADLTNARQLPVTTAFANWRPLWSPDGTRIAAVSDQFGLADVVVVPVAGGDARRVSKLAGVEVPVAWYPDGDRIAYWATTEGANITTLATSISTGLTKPLIPGEKRPYYGIPSPDGLHVAYMVWEGAKSTLWLADSAGKNGRQLTTDGFETLFFSDLLQPWSPDGTQILYESRRTGTADLWIAPVDAGKPRQLTRDVHNDYSGSWSHDGKWIAFMSNRGKQTDVWVVLAIGGTEQRVTDSAIHKQGPPAWRRGTNEIAYSTQAARSGLWAMDLGDGKERRLTPDSIRPLAPIVSPSGNDVAFLIERGGGVQDVVVAPVAGGAARELFAGGNELVGGLLLTWSPDASRLLFSSDRGGSPDVWVADLSSGTARQLTTWPGGEYNATWSADGAFVYFLADRDSKLGDIWRVSAGGGEPARVTRLGNVGGTPSPMLRTGTTDFIVSTLGNRAGQAVISRMRPDGSAKIVWDRSNATYSSISPSGDSLAAMVEQPDGKPRSMILATDGGGGRVALNPGEQLTVWSTDGKSLLYEFAVGGATEIGLFNRIDGTTRRLTTTPEDENGEQFTPDGRTVVFRRSKTVLRINVLNLTNLLAAKP